jgi:hypothetical protein
MPGETRTDLPTMDSMARRLGDAAEALDAAGSESPGVPDAGDVSPIMGAAIAHLTENAGNVVLGLKGASEEVTQARQDYAARDQAAASSFRGY